MRRDGGLCGLLCYGLELIMKYTAEEIIDGEASGGNNSGAFCLEYLS